MNLGSILLLAGAGLLIWTYSGSAANQAPPAVTAGAPPPDTKRLVADAAASAGYAAGSLLNGDQWNFFYQQVRGIPGPAPDAIWPNQPREFQMSVDEWWSGVSQSGLSGFRISPGFASRIGV